MKIAYLSPLLAAALLAVSAFSQDNMKTFEKEAAKTAAVRKGLLKSWDAKTQTGVVDLGFDDKVQTKCLASAQVDASKLKAGNYVSFTLPPAGMGGGTITGVIAGAVGSVIIFDAATGRGTLMPMMGGKPLAFAVAPKAADQVKAGGVVSYVPIDAFVTGVPN